MSSEADAAKSRGNDALKQGDFKKAVECYTEAIDLGKDSENLHVYYSNRSGAYLSSGNVEKALSDAKKCTSIKPDWAKGHSRKGTALFKKNLMSLAKDAYAKAVELDPSNATYKESLAAAEKQDRINRGLEPGARSTASSSSSSSYTPSGPAAKTLMELLLKDQTKTLCFLFRTLMLFSVVLYLTVSSSFWRYFWILSLLTSGLNLFSTHGKPQFNKEYAARLSADPSAHSVFYTVVFWSARAPVVLAVVPVLLNESLWWADYLKKLLTVAAPGMISTASGLASRIMPVLIDEPQWATLSEPQKWAAANKKLPELSAQGEVSVGFLLIFNLLTPMGNILTTGIYWQFMRVRYMIDTQGAGHHIRAFRKANNLLDPYLSKVPGVSWVWDRIKGLCASMVQFPKPGESAMPKCTIM